MGLEGSAGRAYFACLGLLVPDNFRLDARKTRTIKQRHITRHQARAMANACSANATCRAWPRRAI